MAKTDTLNDDIFKVDYYDEFVAQIVSNKEYQRLEQISKARGLQIIFGFSKMEDWFSIQYDIGFKICDDNGQLISVPGSSRFYDHLYNLISDFPVAVYHKFSKRIEVLTIDQRELYDDCKLFSDYLSGEQLFNN